MATGEITSIIIAGISLMALVVFFWMASRGWNSGSQPLAKIRVRTNDHYHRPAPHLGEDNDAVQLPEWIMGLFFLMILVTTVMVVATRP
jgi:hypothetical protein